MLDQLGLGIVISLQDNFTPQVSKTVQSMERLTSSANSMEQNMQKSMNNLQNIMLAGFSLTQVGGEFERTGKKMLGTIKNLFVGVGNTGAEFETLRNTMKVFFKESTNDAMKWGVDLASKTPFEIQPILSAMSSFKAIQIDVRKEFEYTTAEGKKAQKSFMEFVGDLGAFRPDKGVEGAMMALRNYIGGNKRSLRMLFDVDERLILGREFDTKNMENFQKDYVEFVGKLAPDMLKSLEGTVQQLFSNLGDKWTWFKFQISESGAFDAMKKTLVTITSLFDDLDMEKTTKAFGDIFTSLWKPIDAVISGLARIVKWTVDFASTHPLITKLVLGFLTLGGAMLVISGFIMKTAGMFLILTTSIVSAYANLQIMGTLTKVSMFSGLNLQIGAVVRNLGLFGLIVGIVGLAYANNVDGMRDKLGQLMTDWRNSGRVLEAGLGKGLEGATREHDITINGMMRKLMKLRLVAQIFSKTLFSKLDENGNIPYTNKELQNLEEMGLLPLAKTMAVLRGLAGEFFEGFKTGLVKAYEVAKDFLGFVLIPIKAILEKLSGFAPIKALSSLFGFGNDRNGLTGKDAQDLEDRFKSIGEAIGKVLGTLMGFKIVGGISSIIAKPFEGLFKILQRSNGEAKKLKENVTGVGTGTETGKQSLVKTMYGKASRTVTKVQGAYGEFKERKTLAKDRFKSYLHERQDIPNTQSSSYKGYGRVPYTSAPSNLADFSLKQGANPHDLYTKTPKGRMGQLGQALFGAKYYNPSSDGSGMEYVGKYGGRLTKGMDDKQTRLSSQRLGVTKPNTRDLLTTYGGDVSRWKADRKSFIRQDDRAGNLSNLKGSSYDRMVEKVRGHRESYISEKISNPKVRSQMYRDAGIDGRKFNEDPKGRANFLRRGMFADPEVQRMSSRIEAVKGMADRQAPVFKAKQSGISKALFGQRLYTPEQDASGRNYERTVSRVGGIFRNRANDGVYRDEGDTSFRGRMGRVGGAIKSTKVGGFLSGVGTRVGAGARGIAGGIGGFAGKVGGVMGRAGGFAGRVLGAPMGFLNTQRARLGMGAVTGRQVLGGAGRGIMGAGRGIMGGARFLGRGVGAVGRGIGAVGRGAGRVLGGIGRFGMGAMMMAPLIGMGVSAGKAGYNKVKEMGGGDLGKGVGVLREKLAKIDFGQVFKNLGKGFKDTVSAFSPLIKDVLKKIATEMPPILGKAWEGIKAMAQVAWNFVKDNGAEILGGFVGFITPILGNIWESVKTMAGNAWKWVTSEGFTKIGTLVGNIAEWLIGTGVPKLINALMGIGKWLITEGLPNGLVAILKFGVEVGKGLFNGIVTALGGLGNALGRAMLGALKGVIRLLLPKGVEGIVLSALGLNDVPTHHGGLWMSPDEHSAIIKRDETVLPSDKSRRLDSLLDNVSGRGNNSNTKTEQVDNSINIEKVDIVVQADKLSRADARAQAKLILEEFKKLQKEKNIRQYV